MKGIIELRGKEAEKADEELVQFALRILRPRGWKCQKQI